jgi:hypothetical protein
MLADEFNTGTPNTKVSLAGTAPAVFGLVFGIQVNPAPNPLIIEKSHAPLGVKFWFPQRSSPPGALNKTASLVPGNCTASTDRNPVVVPPGVKKCEASIVSVSSKLPVLSGTNVDVIV